MSQALFIQDLRRLGLNPKLECQVVTYELEPVTGSLSGQSVVSGVEVAELAGWPQVPPHWIHLPAAIRFQRTNTQASPLAGWLKHSRKFSDWGNHPAGVSWVRHVRAVLGEAI